MENSEGLAIAASLALALSLYLSRSFYLFFLWLLIVVWLAGGIIRIPMQSEEKTNQFVA